MNKKLFFLLFFAVYCSSIIYPMEIETKANNEGVFPLDQLSPEILQMIAGYLTFLDDETDEEVKSSLSRIKRTQIKKDSKELILVQKDYSIEGNISQPNLRGECEFNFSKKMNSSKKKEIILSRWTDVDFLNLNEMYLNRSKLLIHAYAETYGNFFSHFYLKDLQAETFKKVAVDSIPQMEAIACSSNGKYIAYIPDCSEDIHVWHLTKQKTAKDHMIFACNGNTRGARIGFNKHDTKVGVILNNNESVIFNLPGAPKPTLQKYFRENYICKQFPEFIPPKPAPTAKNGTIEKFINFLKK